MTRFNIKNNGRKFVVFAESKEHAVTKLRDSLRDAVSKIDRYKNVDIWKDEAGNLYADFTIRHSGKRLADLKTKDINEAKRVIERQISFLMDETTVSRWIKKNGTVESAIIRHGNGYTFYSAIIKEDKDFGSLDEAEQYAKSLGYTKKQNSKIEDGINDIESLVKDLIHNDQIRISNWTSDGKITLDSNQLYSIDVEELARVIRQRGHKCDILNTRTVKLRDINSLKDSIALDIVSEIKKYFPNVQISTRVRKLNSSEGIIKEWSIDINNAKELGKGFEKFIQNLKNKYRSSNKAQINIGTNGLYIIAMADSSIKDSSDYTINYRNSYTGERNKETIKANSAIEAIKKFADAVALRGWGTRNIDIISISPNDGYVRLFGKLSDLLKSNDFRDCDSIKDASYTIGGYKDKNDPIAQKDIKMAKKYNVEAYLEKTSDGYQLVLRGNVKNLQDVLDNYFGLDSAGISDENNLMDSNLEVGKTYTSKSGNKLIVKKLISGFSDYNGEPYVDIYYDFETTDGKKGSSKCNTNDFFRMLKDSSINDYDYIGNAMIMNKLPKVGDMANKYNFGYSDSVIVDIKKTGNKNGHSIYTIYCVDKDDLDRYKKGVGGTYHYTAAIKDKSVFSKETMNSVQEGIEKDYASMRKRISQMKDELEKLNSRCSEIEDERLSPMTYAKLKELGYSSEDWEGWTQEHANKVVEKSGKDVSEKEKTDVDRYQEYRNSLSKEELEKQAKDPDSKLGKLAEKADIRAGKIKNNELEKASKNFKRERVKENYNTLKNNTFDIDSVFLDKNKLKKLGINYSEDEEQNMYAVQDKLIELSGYKKEDFDSEGEIYSGGLLGIIAGGDELKDFSYMNKNKLDNLMSAAITIRKILDE